MNTSMRDEPKPRKRKGECDCAAHAKGVSVECGHSVFVHGKKGCMYSVRQFDKSQTCHCPQAKGKIEHYTIN
jgi:hypothetical protein